MSQYETVQAVPLTPLSPSSSSSNLKQKVTIGYKDLMKGYQAKVIHLAGDTQKGEVQLVVNLFQSVLDGFIRGEMKKEEEPVKVNIVILFSLFQKTNAQWGNDNNNNNNVITHSDQWCNSITQSLSDRESQI